MKIRGKAVLIGLLAIVGFCDPSLAQLDREYQEQQSGRRPRQERGKCWQMWRNAQFQRDRWDHRQFIDSSNNVWRVNDWRGTPVQQSGRVKEFTCRKAGRLNVEVLQKERRLWKYAQPYDTVENMWKIEGDILVEYAKQPSGTVVRHEVGNRRY